VADWRWSEKLVAGSSVPDLSSCLGAGLLFAGYFYFTYFPGIEPMLNAKGV
jgi:hypothetical protein